MAQGGTGGFSIVLGTLHYKAINPLSNPVPLEKMDLATFWKWALKHISLQKVQHKDKKVFFKNSLLQNSISLSFPGEVSKGQSLQRKSNQFTLKGKLILFSFPINFHLLHNWENDS